MVRMPKIGMDLTDSTVSAILKRVGDEVAAGEVVIEIATDKANTQIEADDDGVIADVFVSEGDIVSTGTPLFEVKKEDE